jgi:hypothetical protein
LKFITASGSAGNEGQREDGNMDTDDALSTAPVWFQPLEGSDAKDGVLYNKDLVLRIFFNLEFSHVATAAIVCSTWHDIASSKEFWSTVNMQGRPVTLEQVCSKPAFQWDICPHLQVGCDSGNQGKGNASPHLI